MKVKQSPRARLLKNTNISIQSWELREVLMVQSFLYGFILLSCFENILRWCFIKPKNLKHEICLNQFLF